jgi:HEAT repeat protein
MSDAAQLIQDLTSSDVATRKKAVMQAGEAKIKESIPTLIHLLQTDTDSVVRNSAARALGKINDPDQHDIILDALCQATTDSDYYTRANACWSLGKLKDKRALPFLTKMIQPNQIVYMTTGDGKIDTSQKTVSAELKETGVQYTDTILKAIGALAEIGDPDAIPALLQALKEESDGNIRCAAALALGKVRSPEALDRLIAALNDKFWYVRRDIAKAFKDYKDPKTIKPLIRLLNDMYDQVKKNAMDALIAIGKPAAKDLLLLFLAQPTNPQLKSFIKTLTKPEMIALIDELIQNETDPAKKDKYIKFLTQLQG